MAAEGVNPTALQDRKPAHHERAHPTRGGAAKPRDSPSQPGYRMETEHSDVLGWNSLDRRTRHAGQTGQGRPVPASAPLRNADHRDRRPCRRQPRGPPVARERQDTAASLARDEHADPDADPRRGQAGPDHRRHGRVIPVQLVGATRLGRHAQGHAEGEHLEGGDIQRQLRRSGFRRLRRSHRGSDRRPVERQAGGVQDQHDHDGPGRFGDRQPRAHRRPDPRAHGRPDPRARPSPRPPRPRSPRPPRPRSPRPRHPRSPRPPRPRSPRPRHRPSPRPPRPRSPRPRRPRSPRPPRPRSPRPPRPRSPRPPRPRSPRPPRPRSPRPPRPPRAPASPPIPALLTALADNKVTDIVVANGTYRVARPAARPRTRCGSARGSRAGRARSPSAPRPSGGVTFDGGGGTPSAASASMAGAHDQTWDGFTSPNGRRPARPASSCSAATPGMAAPHHITLRNFTIPSVAPRHNVRPTTPSTSATRSTPGARHPHRRPHRRRAERWGSRPAIHLDHGYASTAERRRPRRHGPQPRVHGHRRDGQQAIILWEPHVARLAFDGAPSRTPLGLAVRFESIGSKSCSTTSRAVNARLLQLAGNPPGVAFINDSFH